MMSKQIASREPSRPVAGPGQGGALTPWLRRQLRRRIFWLLALLAVLALILYAKRDLLGGYPNSQARRALRERDLAGALDWLDISERLAPGNPEKEFLLARVRRREGRLQDMRACLENARRGGWSPELVRREEWLGWAQSGRLREAEEHWDELSAAPRDDAGEICEAFVMGYLRNYRLQDALELLAVWEADFPADPQPHFWRGQIRQEQRAWSAAADEFQQALQRDPQHAEAALELADVHVELKRHADALHYYGVAAAAGADAAAARLGRARCLTMLGRHAEARRLLRALVRAAPADPDAAVELAQLEVESGRHAQALELLAPLAPREPFHLDLQHAYAMALRGANRLEEAQARLEAVSEIRRQRHRASTLVMNVTQQPDNPDLRCEVGATYLHNGDEKAGLIWLASALECDPRHRETHRVLADYYARHSARNPRFQSLAQNHRRLSGE
jgi:tetratricopeptide (TPR) repeat protein